MFGGEGMTLQIIAGRSGTGKTTYLMDEVSVKIKQNSKTYIFIVPDQMTFQMETSFFKQRKFRRNARDSNI